MNPTRRQVLGGGAGLLAGYLLTGCGGNGAAPPPHGSSPDGSSSSPPVLSEAGQAAIRNEQELLGAYDAVVARYPTLTTVLTVPRDHHRAHLAALRGPATPTTSPLTVPPTPGSALQALIGLEQAAAQQRQGAAISDLGYGSLLAAIAGAETVHVDLLTWALAGLGGSS